MWHVLFSLFFATNQWNNVGTENTLENINAKKKKYLVNVEFENKGYNNKEEIEVAININLWYSTYILFSSIMLLMLASTLAIGH